MTDQLILAQIKMMPDALKKEVLDFIGYLISKHNLPTENKTADQPAQGKQSFAKLRGSLKSGLSLQEIDNQLQQIRDEWERPVF
jgi:Protein of unknown function (DUF2281)